MGKDDGDAAEQGRRKYLRAFQLVLYAYKYHQGGKTTVVFCNFLFTWHAHPPMALRTWHLRVQI